MKPYSFRGKDQAHLQDILNVDLIDAAWKVCLLPQQPERLQQLTDDPHG